MDAGLLRSRESLARFGEHKDPTVGSESSDPETEDDEETGRSRFWEDYFELLDVAKRSLDVEYREDGPPVGFQFEELPNENDAFGKTTSRGAPAKGKKKLIFDDYEGDVGDDGKIGIRKRKSTAGGTARGRKSLDAASYEEQLQKKRHQEELRAEKKRLEEERKAKREQDKESKKRERMLMKERERIEREQKKKLEKEEKEREKELKRKQREEERLRQQHEREQKRLEKEKDKERRAEERKRQQEEKRREKELQKALTAKVKAAQKELQKQMDAGPPDDLVLEWERIVETERAHGYGSDTDGAEVCGRHAVRPEFPPPSLQLQKAFPKMGDEMGGNLLMAWSFVHSFRDILGVDAFTVDELIEALFKGQASEMLCNIHIGLIRLIQADMEESHYLVVTQGGGGTANFMDRAVVGIASVLDEAWSWGFDVDCWRAHLNAITWPEILRQLSIAAGRGPRKPKPGRDVKPKLGTEGEDVVLDESGGLRLKMPSRFAPGTVKAAAWQVLTEAGPEGLMIAEIAKRIQKQGLRDLRTSKTPEASVAGGLSRDVVFTRVAPATYALQAVVAHHRRLLQNKEQNVGHDEVNQTLIVADCCTPHHSSPKSSTDKSPSDDIQMLPLQGDDMDVSDEEEVSEAEEILGESWIAALMEKDYDCLSFHDRLTALSTLCNMALDGPTIRACLDVRLENQSAEFKRKEAEERAEKRLRAEQAAEEAQRRLLQLGTHPTALPQTASNNLDGSFVESIMSESLQTVAPEKIKLPTSSSHPSANPQHAIRYECVGLDRRYNRYWKFTNPSMEGVPLDPCSQCIFVESGPDGGFRLLENPDQIGELKLALDGRGAREGLLMAALCREEAGLHADGMPSWQEKPELNLECMHPEKKQRIGDFEPCWLSSISTFAERWTTGDDYISNLNFPATDTPILQKLKIDMMRIEEVLAGEALENWDRLAWAEQTRNASTLEELRSCLGHLENGLVADVVSPYFARSPYIVRGAWRRVRGEVASAIPGKKGEYVYLVDTPGIESCELDPLAWLPATYAAVSLRLLSLDASIIYRATLPPGRDTLEAYKYVQKPRAKELEPAENACFLQNVGKGVRITSCQRIDSSGRVAGSMLPAFKKRVDGEPQEEFTVPVVELEEAVGQAEADGSLFIGVPPGAALSRGPRGGRSSGIRGRGGRGGRGATAPKRKRRSSLAMELEREEEEEEDDDPLDDLAFGGYYDDHGFYGQHHASSPDRMDRGHNY